VNENEALEAQETHEAGHVLESAWNEAEAVHEQAAEEPGEPAAEETGGEAGQQAYPLRTQGADALADRGTAGAEMRRSLPETQAARQRQAELVRRAREKVQSRKRDLAEFVRCYPEVKAESIPAEVWKRVADGASLTGSFAMYQNRQLRAKLAAQEQNRRSAARTPGSMGSQGDRGEKSISDYWDEAGE